MAINIKSNIETAVELKDKKMPTVSGLTDGIDVEQPQQTQEQPQELPQGTPVYAGSQIPNEPGMVLPEESSVGGVSPETAQVKREMGTGFSQALGQSVETASNGSEFINPAKLEPVKWEVVSAKERDDALIDPDGGLLSRLKVGVDAFANGNIKFGLGTTSKASNLLPAFEAAEAVGMDGQVKEDFLAVGLAVTEEAVYNSSFFDSGLTEGDITQAINYDNKRKGILDTDVDGPIEASDYSDFTKQGLNTNLGKAINDYYQRNLGYSNPKKIDTESATLLGDAFLESFRLIHPDLIIIPPTGNLAKSTKKFILTPKGGSILSGSADTRARLLQASIKHPMKVKPVDNNYISSGKLNQKKQSKGIINLLTDEQKPKETGKAAIVEEAKANAASVGHVVDDNRLSFLYLMLPSLMSDKPTGNPEIDNMMATALGFGKDKLIAFYAEENKRKKLGLNRDPENPYKAEQQLKLLKVNKAQYIKAIASNVEGVNYQTFFHMPYNLRMSAEQTHFNSTNSKIVRQVTRNTRGVVITRGSRTERNYLESVAMMLIPDGGKLLPDERIRLARSPEMMRKLLGWGRRLKQANQLTTADVKSISQLIANSVPLDDPRYQAIAGNKQLALDPEIDSELIKHLTKSGPDNAIAVMDGLVDYVRYYESVVMNDKPHVTYFNAYMDGKTNGIATIGAMFGIEGIALRTGVMRSQSEQLIDDDKDIRDQLTDYLFEYLKTTGIPGIGKYESKDQTAIMDVLQLVFTKRDLHKYTTMTVGYNKELSSFTSDIRDKIYEVKTIGDFRRKELEKSGASPKTIESDEAVILAGKIDKLGALKISPDIISEMAIGPYITGLHHVLDDMMFKVRSVVKGMAMISAMTNEPIVVRSYSGELMTYAGASQETYDDVVERDGDVNYSLTSLNTEQKKGEDEPTTTKKRSQFKAYSYKNKKASGSAPKYRGGKPGQKAIVSTQVGMVQSVDAMAMAMTFSGKSWDKINQASKGSPYIFPIYDAIKVDMASFDVARKEINDNWYEASTNWNLVEEVGNAVNLIHNNFNKTIAGMIKDGVTEVKVGEGEDYQMIGHLIELNRFDKPSNFYRAVADATRLPMTSEDKNNASYAGAVILGKFKRQYGFDVTNPKRNKDGDVVMTPKQIQGFVRLFSENLSLATRQNRLVGIINDNKSKLKAKLKGLKETNPMYAELLQYYDH